ncbi:MAG: pyridoxamine 5'-phosphate oxidase family protein [Slackia sp.]|nr:pyridoxamine 5'-phosphate oxidase family protein [Slackia sp.]
MKDYEMRRATRRMKLEEAKNVLERGTYCTVSCIDENGRPYGVPLSYAYVHGEGEANGTLYFHTTNQGGRKIDAFVADGRACATVVEDVAARFESGSFTTGFSSVMASGHIRRVTDSVTIRKALVDLCMKYLPEHKRDIGAAMDADLHETAVWALDIEELSGKRN